MAKYWINTPIKVSKNKIIPPGGRPVELNDKIASSLPAHALTPVEKVGTKQPETKTPTGGKSGDDDDGDGAKTSGGSEETEQ